MLLFILLLLFFVTVVVILRFQREQIQQQRQQKLKKNLSDTSVKRFLEAMCIYILLLENVFIFVCLCVLAHLFRLVAFSLLFRFFK